MPAFDAVASEYDEARPDYPAGVYDALGSLEGLTVLDVGAGTGIATRQLLERRTRIVAVDPGCLVLAKAVVRTPGLAGLVADGVDLPVRHRAVDLVCFAQAWHWLDPATRVREVHRVLRSGGRWAAWWSHARADTDPWFDAYWSAIEASCPGTHRDQRDIDWGATVEGDMFDVGSRVVVPWTRTVSTDEWLRDQSSHSYVAGLETAARDALVLELRRIIEIEFTTATMTIPYETWLWTATMR